MTADGAADVAWALTADEVFSLLVELRGWPHHEDVAWSREALVRELLAN